MAAVANNPEFAKKAGVLKSVGEEFMKEDKLKMVEKGGKKVPFYAADGKGKMMAGGKVKGYKSGCSVKSKGYKSGGKVRGCGMARGGAVRPCKMVKMKGA